MIHDNYTREADERRERKQWLALKDKLLMIGNVARRMGLKMIYNRTSGVVTLNYPNGQEFGAYKNVECALVWARKWRY